MLVRQLVAITLVFSFVASTVVSAQATITQADINRKKAEVELLKQDIEIKQAEIRVMELQLSRQSSTAAKPAMPTKTPEPTQVAASPPITPMRPLITTPPKKANVDPMPYEDSILGKVSQFRTSQSLKWRVLDEKRVVFWVLNDEAYLLNLTQTCPGLLDATKLSLEKFASKVRAGYDGVIFDDQRCLIESINLLGGRSLPRPPRQ